MATILIQSIIDNKKLFTNSWCELSNGYYSHYE